MPRVLTLTPNPSIDLECEVDRLVPHQKLRTTEPEAAPGGGGINVSRVVARLGGDSVAVYPVGGHRGELLPELLAAENVLGLTVETDGETRENLTIAEAATGERYRFVLPGGALTGVETKECAERLFGAARSGDFLVASGSLPPGAPADLYGEFARRAADLGLPFLLDSSGEPLRRALEAGVYLVKPNARELREALDDDLPTADHLAAGARRLISEGAARIVVVSVAGEGAIVVTEDGIQRLEAPQVDVVSPVGAGDCMVGAIAFSLARDAEPEGGRAISDAARLGVGAGSAAVMTPGSGLCLPDDVRDLAPRVKAVA